MKRNLLVAAAVLAVLSGPALAVSPQPTPTPTPAAKKRKLAGGSFGLSTTPTPAGRSSADSLAEAARKTQEEATAPDARPSRKIVITNETLGKFMRELFGAEAIPLPDNSVDVVMMFKSLHHVPGALLGDGGTNNREHHGRREFGRQPQLDVPRGF